MKTQEVKDIVSPRKLYFIEVLAALEALPTKELIRGRFNWADLKYCAVGAVERHRGTVDRRMCDHYFEVEVIEENDNGGPQYETMAQRYIRMHKWVKNQIMEG